MDTPDVVRLADVEIGHERHLLEAAMRRHFVLGFGEAEWRLAWRLYTTPPYRSADAVAGETFGLVQRWLAGQKEER